MLATFRFLSQYENRLECDCLEPRFRISVIKMSIEKTAAQKPAESSRWTQPLHQRQKTFAKYCSWCFKYNTVDKPATEALNQVWREFNCYCKCNSAQNHFVSLSIRTGIQQKSGNLIPWLLELLRSRTDGVPLRNAEETTPEYLA